MITSICKEGIMPEKLEECVQVCTLLSQPIVVHIIDRLSDGRDVTARYLISSQFSYHTILKYLRGLMSVGIVRKEHLGTEVTYKMNNARFNTVCRVINSI